MNELLISRNTFRSQPSMVMITPYIIEPPTNTTLFLTIRAFTKKLLSDLLIEESSPTRLLDWAGDISQRLYYLKNSG